MRVVMVVQHSIESSYVNLKNIFLVSLFKILWLISSLHVHRMDKSVQAIRECLHNHDLRSTMVQDGPPPPPISETVVVVSKPTPVRSSARVSKKAKLDLLTSKLLNL